MVENLCLVEDGRARLPLFFITDIIMEWDLLLYFCGNKKIEFSMDVLECESMKSRTSFGIEAKARYYGELSSLEDALFVVSSSSYASIPKLVLGGGSNMLFCSDYDGMVLKPVMKELVVEQYASDYVIVRVGAGVVWDDFVSYCVDNEFYGVENLSFIPGNVGASPVQNIGAYGVEVRQVIYGVEAVDMVSGRFVCFTNAECEFGYRDSVFKNDLKGRYIVVAVRFRLGKKASYSIDYKDIKGRLKDKANISLRLIRDTIIEIRKEKLPDPCVLGNAGSFFKNPVVSEDKIRDMSIGYPSIPVYRQADGSVKVAAGWLIEKAGWKGFRRGDAGVHDRQALVLVNYGKASGREIASLASEIQASVLRMFDVMLEPEVHVLGN